MKIHGTSEAGAIGKKDFGVAFSSNGGGGGFTDEGLKAYWKFEESSGSIVNQSESDDSLGTNANIAITGASYSQTSTPTDFSTSVSFDGTNDYGVAGTTAGQWNFLHNTSALYTKILWMRFSSGGTGEPCFLGDAGFSAGTIGNDIGFFDTDQILDAIYNGGSVNATCVNATGNNYIPDTTNWHMYAFTYDISLASNNSEIRRDNANLKQANNTGVAASDSNSSYNMSLMINPRNTLSYIGCYACEWSVWNRVLDEESQTHLWNDGDGIEIY